MTVFTLFSVCRILCCRFDEFLQAQLAALVSRHDLRLRLDSSHLLQGYVDASRSYDQLTPSSRLQLLDGVCLSLL